MLIIDSSLICARACHRKLFRVENENEVENKDHTEDVKKAQPCIIQCAANFMEAFEIVSMQFGTTSKMEEN